MNIISEKPSTDVIMEFDMTKEEQDILANHALRNIPRESMIHFLVEWAVVDILRKAVDSEEAKIAVKKAKKKVSKK